MTSREMVKRGMALSHLSYRSRSEFLKALVTCIEETITLALEEKGAWDDLTEYQAEKIINTALPLFHRLGAWWGQFSVITIPLYKHFCKMYDAGPEAFVDVNYDLRPPYQRRVCFM